MTLTARVFCMHLAIFAIDGVIQTCSCLITQKMQDWVQASSYRHVCLFGNAMLTTVGASLDGGANKHTEIRVIGTPDKAPSFGNRHPHISLQNATPSQFPDELSVFFSI